MMTHTPTSEDTSEDSHFLHDATNTSEVFSGTASGITAGNLKLTTNTNSTSNTTGDLVVAGGVGIGDDVNIGGH